MTEHIRRSEYRADGVRARCDCGWVGKWHAAVTKGAALTDWRKHHRAVSRREGATR